MEGDSLGWVRPPFPVARGNSCFDVLALTLMRLTQTGVVYSLTQRDLEQSVHTSSMVAEVVAGLLLSPTVHV